jgi:hypothetical protein
MKPRILPAILVSAISAGWLLPLAWSVQSYLRYLDLVFLPKVRGETPLASAPLNDIALLQFYISCAWLFIVIAGWAYVGYRATKRVAP